MTTSAKASYGVTFTWNSVAIGEVTGIGGLKTTVEFRDVTSHESANAFRESIPTLLKAEPIKVNVNFLAGDTTGQQAMVTDHLAKTSRTFIVTFPTSVSATWTGTGYVEDIEIQGFDDVTGSQKAVITIHPTGKPTLALTASGGLTGLTGIEENTGAALDFIPNFATGTYTYTVAANALSSYVKFTPTAASHTITITDDYDSSVATVATGNQSGELDLGAVNTVTKFTIECYETGKVSKKYYVYVTRAAS